MPVIKTQQEIDSQERLTRAKGQPGRTLGSTTRRTGDAITVLVTENLLLVKTWQQNGTIKGYDNAKYFRVESRRVAGIEQLSQLLTELEKNPRACIVRGRYVGPDRKKTQRLSQYFEDAPLHAVMIDVDGYEPIIHDQVPAVIDEYISASLPRCFRDVSYHWQLSNSAGHADNAGKLKAHLWFWLRKPYTSAHLKAWAKSINLNADHSVFHRSHIHYTGAPRFEAGVKNPIAVRSGFVEKDAEAVHLAIADMPEGPPEHNPNRDPVPLHEVRRALTHIPSDDYDNQFIRFGQAMKHDFGQAGYEPWLTWIKKSSKYQEDDEQKWDTFDHNRDRVPVTCASIIDEAKKHPKAVYAQSRAIGEGPTEADYHPKIFTLEDMLAEVIYISDGSQVALRDDPRLVWSLADFENLTSASVVPYGDKDRLTPVARVWLRHPERETVHARTFRAGGELFCKSPDDVSAINTWREPPRTKAPSDWKERVQPFVEHLQFLIPDITDRRVFAKWLGHIEQEPGVLPHVHFLMIATKQGIGRNWLASVLARAWAGVTALDIDLPQLLDGGFNGRLSRKILAVVNEIHEGAAYRHADRLKGLLTDERRAINPKFGRQHDEFNAVRWLMFSNHTDALPLDRYDRRVYAIRNPDKPKPEKYYSKLYALLHDPLFIASVRKALRNVDITKFSPGMKAPLTKTKEEVIAAGMKEADLTMIQLVEDYPGDCITSKKLLDYLEDVVPSALRHVAGPAGARKFPGLLWINAERRQAKVWILRDYEQWQAAGPRAIAAEVIRGEKAARHGF